MTTTIPTITETSAAETLAESTTLEEHFYVLLSAYLRGYEDEQPWWQAHRRLLTARRIAREVRTLMESGK